MATSGAGRQIDDDREVKRQKIEHEAESAIMYPQASLMGLPTELRLEILEHVLPNIDIVPSDSGRLARGDLREDNQSCTIAVLRVNSRLYEEAIDIVYNRWFELSLEQTTLSLGYRALQMTNDLDVPSIMQDLSLPLRRMRYIEVTVWGSIVICICGETYHDNECPYCGMGLVDGINNLAFLLSDHPDLKELSIDFYDSSVAEEVKKYCERLIPLMTPFKQLPGLTGAYMCVASEEISAEHPDVTDEDMKMVQEIIDDMTSKKPKISRVGNPAKKESFKKALELAKNIGVTSVDGSLLDARSRRGDWAREMTEFARDCWLACEREDDVTTGSHFEALKQMCEWQR